MRLRLFSYVCLIATCLILSVFTVGCDDTGSGETSKGPIHVSWHIEDSILVVDLQVMEEKDLLIGVVSLPEFEGAGKDQLNIRSARWHFVQRKNGWLGATTKAKEVVDAYDFFCNVINTGQAIANNSFLGYYTIKTFEEISHVDFSPSKSFEALRGYAMMMDTMKSKIQMEAGNLRGIPVVSGDKIEVRIPILSNLLKTQITMKLAFMYISRKIYFDAHVTATLQTGIGAPLTKDYSVQELFEQVNRGNAFSLDVLTDSYDRFDALNNLPAFIGRGQASARIARLTPSISTIVSDATINEWLSIPLSQGTQGKLDVVFCIDVSGSMIDDVAEIKSQKNKILEELIKYAKSDDISLQVGLVTYTHHSEPDWLHAVPLTTDIDSLSKLIDNALNIIHSSSGTGGNEDTYGAVMYAMDQIVDSKQVHMGWRGNTPEENVGAKVVWKNQNQSNTAGWKKNAAKIIIPIGDEPQDDPDFEGRTLEEVSRVAENLDPVHMYPLLLPKQGSSFLDPAVRGMEKIAKATKGQVIRVNSAEELPEAIVTTVKLAVRQHRNEVWRQKNPPYFLYGTMLGIVGLILAGLAFLFVHMIMSRNRIDKKNTNSFT